MNPHRPDLISTSSRQVAAFSYSFVAISGLVALAWKRDDDFVRFHALQSILATFAFLGFGLLLRLLSGFPLIGFLYRYLFDFFLLGLFGYWIYLMFRTYRGDRVHVPYLGPIVEGQISA